MMQKFGLYDVFNCSGSREDAGGINISGITTLHRNMQLNILTGLRTDYYVELQAEGRGISVGRK